MKNKLSQTRLIIIGFLLIIFVGSLLLMTPFASKSHTVTPYLDCLFTSTSATCVTGLVVYDTFTQWSLFGQIIILILVQIGGLGFITIGVFFSLFIRKRIGLKFRGLVQESTNALQVGGIIRLTKEILKGTLLFEFAGAIILSIRFAGDFGVSKGIYYGIFHSVSAFCNAGFDLMGINGEFSSLTAYATDPVVNFVIMSLAITGGIGFIVWDDICKNKFKFSKYNLHTKVVLTMTLILVLVPALFYFVMEYNNAYAGLNNFEKAMAALFSSVNTRSAGFSTVDVNSYSEASKMLTITLMFIGAAPGSTSGGIKITTLCVLMVLVWSKITGRNKISVYKRRFSDKSVKEACTIFMLNTVLTVFSSIILLTITNLSVSNMVFEVVAAIGSAGISTGITGSLNSGAMIIIAILMFCGRVGSLSFALSFLDKRKDPPVYYPEEEISIG